MRGSTIKAGTYAMEGWMAYKIYGLIFKKTFPAYPSGDYSGSEHLTTIFYSNGKFIELEPCSLQHCPWRNNLLFGEMGGMPNPKTINTIYLN